MQYIVAPIHTEKELCRPLHHRQIQVNLKIDVTDYIKSIKDKEKVAFRNRC